jgi:hypothetical protein
MKKWQPFWTKWNIIWEWHRFTAVIWKNDTKSFIFPKLKMISVIDTKIYQIILEQVPCLTNFMKKWWPFWTKWSPFLVSTKKHHVQQNVHNTVLLSYTFCTDIIEQIVCRNTCFECNYNIWITFYMFLWNYESIKVGVQLVFNIIWEWHRFNKLFSDKIMAMLAIIDLSVKIKSGSDTFWTVKQIANITSNMFSFIFLTEQLINGTVSQQLYGKMTQKASYFLN